MAERQIVSLTNKEETRIKASAGDHQASSSIASRQHGREKSEADH
jgi:hypothetical protein